VASFTTNARDPVHAPVAAPAVEQEPAELPLQFGRLQELHPQSLRCGNEPGLVARIDLVSLFDDAVCVPGPVRDAPPHGNNLGGNYI
jgi:hypothetical protein